MQTTIAELITTTIGEAVCAEVLGSMEGATYEAEQGWSSYKCGPAAILSLQTKLEAPGRKLILTIAEANWLAEHLRSCEDRLEHPEDRPLGRSCGRTAEKLEGLLPAQPLI